MKIIAVVNLKGGVAKTTTVINTAAIMAKKFGQKVLVIDADSQANCTEFIQRDKMHFLTLADLLRRGYHPENCHIEHSNIDGVDLLPASEGLMDLDLTKVELGSASATCLRDLLKGDNGIGWAYDYALIDCPPAFNAASAAALVAADAVVIPMKLDAFSLRGMGNILRQVRNMQKINAGLKIAGLLPTMWYKADNIRQAEAALKGSGLEVFSHIRRTPKVDDMTFAQLPLIESSPTSAAAKDYEAFVKELMVKEEK